MARPLVLAKDYEQFCHARNEYKDLLENAVYVSTLQTLLGITKEHKVYSYGAAYDNPHYSEYMEFLQTRGIEIQYI